ncbi:hypothetical protein [Thalassotalea ganghwensis]
MKNIKNIWFWFTLIVCPILVVLGVFTLGELIGEFIYSTQSNRPSVTNFQLVFICAGVCAFSVFLTTLKQAKIRFGK